MRIWSIHPKYLDARGLVALWRETLLAKHVLEGKTKGYKHHPQLHRFKSIDYPVAAINQYLVSVYEEAIKRGYNFSKSKVDFEYSPVKLTVAKGQMDYERQHLLNKLKIRDISKYIEIATKRSFDPHPIFEIAEGGIEEWERTK
jgi:hypothetical protein